MTDLLRLVVAFALLALGGGQAAASVYDASLGGPIFQMPQYLTGGQTHVFTTNYLKPAGTADTMLRVFRMNGGDLEEIAWDDDSGPGLGSRVTFTAPSSGLYLIVVHSLLGNAAGEFTLLRSSGGSTFTVASDAPFGGNLALIFGSVDSGERFSTLYEPGRDVPQAHQLLPLDPSYSARAFADSNATAGAATFELDAPASGLGVIVGARIDHTDANGDPQSLTLAREGFGDWDGDGLSNDVEQALGTCRATWDSIGPGGATSCAGYRATDSDLDGLSDRDEVFGYDGVDADLPLRRWGADPLHKDYFVEVDWSNADPTYQILDQWTQTLADTINEAYLEPTAAEVDNPDGLPGIRLHFDIAGTDWLSVPGNPVAFFDGGGSGPANGTCTDYHERRADSLGASRASTFAYTCVGGSGGRAAKPGLASRVTGTSIGGVIVHELGHNLGISHGGHDNVYGKPNYISVMNYAYPGFEARDTNLALWGDPTWFSRGYLVGTDLTPSALCEADGLYPAGNEVVDDTTTFYMNTSGTYGVDWNRDGVVSPCSEPVRAAVNARTLRNSGGVPKNIGYSLARDILDHGAGETYLSTPSIATVRAGSSDVRSYVFYTLENSGGVEYVRYRTAFFPGGDCELAQTSFYGDCVTFSGQITTGVRGDAVAASNFETGVGERVFILSRDGSTLKAYQSSKPSAGSMSWTQEETLSTQAVEEPELLVDGDELLAVWLEGAGPDHDLVWSRRTASGWSTPQAVCKSGGPCFTSRTGVAMAIRHQSSHLAYMLRTRDDGQLEFLYRSGSGWSPSNSYDLDGKDNAGNSLSNSAKPALAWKPYDADDPDGGGGWLYVRTNAAVNRSVVGLFDGGAEIIEGRFDQTHFDFGATYHYDPRMARLQAAYVSTGATGGRIRYLPIADGTFDYTLRDNDDMAFLRVGVCVALTGTDCGQDLPPGYPSGVVEVD